MTISPAVRVSRPLPSPTATRRARGTYRGTVDAWGASSHSERWLYPAPTCKTASGVSGVDMVNVGGGLSLIAPHGPPPASHSTGTHLKSVT